MTPIVQMVNISKSFGPMKALDGVSLDVVQGTIHSVIGENGAGKTTLMRILYGAIRPDEGTVTIRGDEVQFSHTSDAIQRGIGMVSQHYSIIPELSCLENLMLGAEGAWLLKRQDAEARADEIATQMGFTFEWGQEARGLSPAAAQKLEILKLLWRNAEVMILDEPTAMLSPADSDALFESLRQLTDNGATVILVTHRLPEVIEHCKRATVLRGGRRIAELEIEDTDAKHLAELIVGHSISDVGREEVSLGEPLLEVDGLSVLGERGEEALRGIELQIRSGEMLGIAGVDGSGQRELFQALVGLVRTRAGTIQIFGSDANTLSTSKRIAKGLRLIPEDRHEEGVIDEWSLEANAALGLQRLEPIRKGPWVVAKERRELAEGVAARFQTKHSSLSQPLKSLSGGNQQRFVAARALQIEPKLILAFQPTRGLDFDGTQQVYAALRAECRKGAAALVVSFDLDELLEECDRIVAMNGGRLYALPPGREMDRTTIGELMVGAV